MASIQVKKVKIQKTNRINLKEHMIYCSTHIIQECREHLIRVGPKMAPKKGEYDNLMIKLKGFVSTMPEHFPESSRIWIMES